MRTAFNGPSEFSQWVRDALSTAACEGWRTLVLSDPTLADWPLNERAVEASLNQWAAGGRHMLLLATRYDEVMRHHARFVNWRVRWGHLLDCRVCTQSAPGDVPSAIVGPSWYLRRVDLVRSRGYCGTDADGLTQLRELLNEQHRASSPGFTVTPLGL